MSLLWSAPDRQAWRWPAPLAKAGHEVIILNRDIKFGGLAEYGIFPAKLKLRGGLKKAILGAARATAMSIISAMSQSARAKISPWRTSVNSARAPSSFRSARKAPKPSAWKGTRPRACSTPRMSCTTLIGCPGFGDRPFEMGKHVAVIGAGDVMVDIAHWLIRYKKVERVTAIVRRGPAERKYNPKEIRAVCANMDIDGITKEVARIKDRLAAVGQNADEILKGLTDEFTKCEPKASETKMGFKFFASPKRILVDGNNRVRGLEMEDNKLEPKGDDTAAVGLKQYYEFPCDSVVFAVGDKVDETVGLPYKSGVFVTNPNKTGNDPDDALFQAYDETTGKIVDGVFLAGWARKASEGLVGIAKRDGDWCAEVVIRYLATKTSAANPAQRSVLDKLTSILKARKSHPVDVKGLRVLESRRKSHKGATDCIGEFKYASNQEMIDLIERGKHNIRPAFASLSVSPLQLLAQHVIVSTFGKPNNRVRCSETLNFNGIALCHRHSHLSIQRRHRAFILARQRHFDFGVPGTMSGRCVKRVGTDRASKSATAPRD